MAYYLSGVSRCPARDIDGHPSWAENYTPTPPGRRRRPRYQDNAGGSSHTNPIILNVMASPGANLINGGQSIKFALNDANDADPHDRRRSASATPPASRTR